MHPRIIFNWRHVTVFLIGYLPSFAYLQSTTTQHCCTVNETRLWKKTLLGLDPASSKIINPFLQYKFYVPEIQLRAGLDHYGSAIRLRKLVSDLISGSKPFKIGVIGGGTSYGKGAKTRGKDDWFSLFIEWLASVSKTPVSARNGCVPGTSSEYMVLCMQDHVDPDVDLLFVEYCVNDGIDDTSVSQNHVIAQVDRLIQRVLALPGRPAVVLVQAPHSRGDKFREFYRTSEDLEGALSAYYDIPSISARTTLAHLTTIYPTEGFEWNATYQKYYPGNSGHRVFADLAVHLIQTAAIDLVNKPQKATELELLAKPVPRPMYEGNTPPLAPLCFTGYNFKSLVTPVKGSWSWDEQLTETGFKRAYVSSAPGSTMLLVVNTTNSLLQADENVWVFIQYHESHMAMGRARVDCVGGCSCPHALLDAWNEGHTSKTKLHGVLVTQSDACQLQLQLLSQTRSGGYNFKVLGVSIAQPHTAKLVASTR